tara:strand:- start:121 stop:627 length:507 start_codon:yes stop_codon:yes gene_type:complete
MPSSSTKDNKRITLNPLDTIEEMIAAQEWPYHRLSHDEILLEIAGRWHDYRVSFFWNEDSEVLGIISSLEMPVPAERYNDTVFLLHLINQRLGLGHFELSPEENNLVFRYAYLMAGLKSLKSESFEELLEIVISECERFYPAFQFTVLGNKKPEEALSVTLLDTQGEA